MKVIDTLSETDRLGLLLGEYDTAGIFKDLFSSTDFFYPYAHDLNIGYYFGKSGTKDISNLWEQFIKYKEKGIVSPTPDKLISNILKSKYMDKWNRLGELLTKEYDPINNYSITETNAGYDTTTTTYNNTEKTEEDLSGTTKNNTNITTVRSDENSENTYGFNSNSPVPNSENLGSVTETESGDKEDNTTETENDNTIEKKKTGNDKDEEIFDITKTKKGNISTISEIVSKEIDMRQLYNIFDIVYNDIDDICVSYIL